MIIDLEESVEDAICAYLKTKLPGDVRLYPSLTPMDGVQYPYVGVEAAESGNVTDEGKFNGRRTVDVMVALVLEAVPVVNALGKITQTLRDRNRALRAQLWAMLARTDLHEDVNLSLGWTQDPGTKLWSGGSVRVLFSKIMPTESARSVENRQVTTAITLKTIAQPTE